MLWHSIRSDDESHEDAEGYFVALEAKTTRKMLVVVGNRVQVELRDQSCLPLSDIPVTRKSIPSTRTFDRLLLKWEEICEALAHCDNWAA